ncbi:hypothetical protein TSUD_22690 [Trifolium subterraneum]|uniref:Uncharacterized protein n=1 Tax=Trifolium subterraneum TaxID=3900 RepID=A0A2Z6N734_TRISU|nr:hypothetical protein TSUD_22690 [Trifolium subterraneum]
MLKCILMHQSTTPGCMVLEIIQLVTGEIAEKTPEAAKVSCQRSLNFDIGTKDESSENTTVLLGKENGVAEQETNFGITCGLSTSVNVKHTSNSSMSLPEDTQAPDTSSQSSHPETKPKENPTGKKKYVRRKLNKTSAPPAEITGELTTEKMPELAKPPCKSYTNFDNGGMEESSAVKENATTHLSEENVVTEGTNPDLAYDAKTSMKQVSDNNVSLTEDTQTTNTSSKRKSHRTKPKEGPITKRQYMRRSRLNKSSTPTEVSRDLPEKMMPESAKTSCQKSLNFDGGARDESSADRENASVHPCKETGAAMQEIEVGYDMETFMKQKVENNCLSFCNNKQTPTVRPREETGAVMQEIDVSLDYDMETFIKPAAENNYI